jgi:hypothetical protein
LRVLWQSLAIKWIVNVEQHPCGLPNAFPELAGNRSGVHLTDTPISIRGKNRSGSAISTDCAPDAR